MGPRLDHQRQAERDSDKKRLRPRKLLLSMRLKEAVHRLDMEIQRRLSHFSVL